MEGFSSFFTDSVDQGSSTFWVLGPVYIFHIILRAAVIADYKIIMDILNIIIGAQLILQPFPCFTYVIGTSPTSQVILQSFRRFNYATSHSTTLPPLHLCHRSCYNPSVVLPTSQALHVLHLASRPCIGGWKNSLYGLACYSNLLSVEVARVLVSCIYVLDKLLIFIITFHYDKYF